MQQGMIFFNYNQEDATIFYHLFLKGCKCFGRLCAHHQEKQQCG